MNRKQFLHQWLWVILVSFCFVGPFYPVIGAAALICMAAPVIMAFFKGRKWCGVFCPRGSFLDIPLAILNPKRGVHGKIPLLFKKIWFRLSFFGLLMGAFAVQLVLARGNLFAIGQVFVRMIVLTTLLALILGLIYNRRTWCLICPMGTLAWLVSKRVAVQNSIPHISFRKDRCVNCKLCSKNCPVEIDVHAHLDQGKVLDPNCLKCQVCVAKCPKKALHVA